jgi:hypothetical protein
VNLVSSSYCPAEDGSAMQAKANPIHMSMTDVTLTKPAAIESRDSPTGEMRLQTHAPEEGLQTSSLSGLRGTGHFTLLVFLLALFRLAKKLLKKSIPVTGSYSWLGLRGFFCHHDSSRDTPLI